MQPGFHEILQATDPTDSTADGTMGQTRWPERSPVPLGTGQTVKVPALLCSCRRSRQGCKGTSVSSSVHYYVSLLNESELTSWVRVGAVV